MKKVFASIFIFTIIIFFISTKQITQAEVLDYYALHFSPEDIVLLFELNSEDDNLAIQVEEICGVDYTHMQNLSNRNQYILKLLDVLENIEIPMLWGELPYDIYYRPQSDCVEFYYSTDDSGYVRYSVYFPASKNYQDVINFNTLEKDPFLVLENNVCFYGGSERLDKYYYGTVYIWSCLIQTDAYVIICEYVGKIEHSNVLNADGIKQVFIEAPITTIKKFCSSQNDIKPYYLLQYCIVGATVFTLIVAGIITIVIVKKRKHDRQII